MLERKSNVKRESKETNISLELLLDGVGSSSINTGIGFFDHMLTLFSAHGKLDLKLDCLGDLNIDGHHTVEDVGIVLGKAIKKALGERKGIKRYGTVFIPMDESLAMVSIDISGRPYLNYEMPEISPQVGTFDTQLVEEFFRAITNHCGLTLHIRVLYGRNTHHMIEAVFKAFGRAMKIAASLEDVNNQEIPSTKGILD